MAISYVRFRLVRLAAVLREKRNGT
jgi:hypothetical protein